MKRIRSKSIRGKKLYLLIGKIVTSIVVVMVAIMVVFTVSAIKTGNTLKQSFETLAKSISSTNYEAQFNDKTMSVTGSDGAITYKITEGATTYTVVTSPESSSYFISIPGVQWGEGNSWLEIPSYRLENEYGNTWVPQDIYRYINVDALRELATPGVKSYIKLGFTGIQSSFKMKTPLVVTDSSISLVGNTYLKNGEAVKRTSIRLVDSWENGISTISKVTFTDNGVEIVTDKGVMKVKAMTSTSSGLSWEALHKVIITSCAHIDQVDANLSGKIFELYRNGNNIIESVKGALRNE